MTEALSDSLEDYLEAIYQLSTQTQGARVKDIANRLQVRAPSVNAALRTLAEHGLVNYVPYDAITLTAAGRTAAVNVVRRHEALLDFLVNVLAVEASEAENAACAMEHAVSEPILERLIQFAEFMSRCPRCGQHVMEAFIQCRDRSMDTRRCAQCLRRSLEKLASEPAPSPHPSNPSPG